MCKYTNIIYFEFDRSILRLPSYIIVGPEHIPHMIQDNSGHFLAFDDVTLINWRKHCNASKKTKAYVVR